MTTENSEANIDSILEAVKPVLDKLAHDKDYFAFYSAMTKGDTELLWKAIKSANIPGLTSKKAQFIEQAKQMELCKEVANMMQQLYGDRIKNRINDVSEIIRNAPTL